MGFVEEFDLLDAAQRDAAAGIARKIVESGVELVRLGFVDLHGIIRGKTIVASELSRHHDAATEGHVASHGILGF
jgi:glutamine synthetase